jgi:hypothetical protein
MSESLVRYNHLDPERSALKLTVAGVAHCQGGWRHRLLLANTSVVRDEGKGFRPPVR